MRTTRTAGQRFERHRGRLRAVAYRMLGSLSEADDAVQEAWLRLSRTGVGEIGSLEGWLRTVVSPDLPRHAAHPDGRGARNRSVAGVHPGAGR